MTYGLEKVRFVAAVPESGCEGEEKPRAGCAFTGYADGLTVPSPRYRVSYFKVRSWPRQASPPSRRYTFERMGSF